MPSVRPFSLPSLSARSPSMRPCVRSLPPRRSVVRDEQRGDLHRSGRALRRATQAHAGQAISQGRLSSANATSAAALDSSSAWLPIHDDFCSKLSIPGHNCALSHDCNEMQARRGKTMEGRTAESDNKKQTRSVRRKERVDFVLTLQQP